MFSAVLVVAFVSAVTAAAITHGKLRPELESRGIIPWKLRDTLASAPLILVGSAGCGTGCAMIVGSIAGFAPVMVNIPTFVTLIAGIVVAALSALMLMLGVIALRKLR